MADRREMLARLNPQTVRFDVGQGGGAPSLTTSDIAAALGMVPAGLGREVMEAVYLPDGALRHRAKLSEAVLAIVRPEFTRRARGLAEAEDDLSFSKEMVSLSRRNLSDAQRRILREREAAVAVARGRAWPKNTYQHLSRMVDAVVLELASGNRCASAACRRGTCRACSATTQAARRILTRSLTRHTWGQYVSHCRKSLWIWGRMFRDCATCLGSLWGHLARPLNLLFPLQALVNLA